MRIVIADDEQPARAKLRRLLADQDGVSIVGEASSGTEAVDRIRALAPDLVLLDVQMPGLDGFGVVETIGPDAMPPVVFVTAYDEHAVRAVEVQALDYLLKPVTPERFRAMFVRVRRMVEREDAQAGGGLGSELPARLRRLLADVSAEPAHLRHFMVPHGERVILVPVDRVTRVSAERNYAVLHTPDGSFQVRSTISALEARLDPAVFLRINRSDIVRLDGIREMHPWSHGDYHVVMRDGTRLVWSRRYRARNAHRFG